MGVPNLNCRGSYSGLVPCSLGNRGFQISILEISISFYKVGEAGVPLLGGHTAFSTVPRAAVVVSGGG